MKRVQQAALILFSVVFALTVAGCDKGKPISPQMGNCQMTDAAMQQPGDSRMPDSTAQQSGGGHDSTMAREDPIPFLADIDKASQNIVDQVKAWRVMDAQNSVSQLSGAADKVLPHITDTALKDNLSATINAIKAGVNSGSPDSFELEEKNQSLLEYTRQAREKLREMGS